MNIKMYPSSLTIHGSTAQGRRKAVEASKTLME